MKVKINMQKNIKVRQILKMMKITIMKICRTMGKENKRSNFQSLKLLIKSKKMK